MMKSEEQVKEEYEYTIRQYAYLLSIDDSMYASCFWKTWAIGDILGYSANKISGDLMSAIAQNPGDSVV